MRKFIISILLVLIFLKINTGSVHAGVPKLFIPDPIQNLGEIIEGQIVECTFIIKNIGDATLAISNVTPDCGCTKVRIMKPAIADLEDNGEPETDISGEFRKLSLVALIIGANRVAPWGIRSDGSELYQFDAKGRHLETRDTTPSGLKYEMTGTTAIWKPSPILHFHLNHPALFIQSGNALSSHRSGTGKGPGIERWKSVPSPILNCY